MSESLEKSFEYKLAKEQTVVYIWRSVMQEYVYKFKDMQKFYEQVKDIAPARCEFFINWFKGFTAVADFDFDGAKSFYSAAFKTLHRRKNTRDALFSRRLRSSCTQKTKKRHSRSGNTE